MYLDGLGPVQTNVELIDGAALRAAPSHESISDVTPFHHGVDLSLCLSFVEAVLGHHLVDKLVSVLERTKLMLGKLVPLGADVLEQDLLAFRRVSGIAILICGVHGRSSKECDKTSFECASFKQRSVYGEAKRQPQGPAMTFRK
jgi:hypothetical protein